MNLPPKDFKRIRCENLTHFAEDCLKTAGLREDHAFQLAELLVNGGLRGLCPIPLCSSVTVATLIE